MGATNGKARREHIVSGLPSISAEPQYKGCWSRNPSREGLAARKGSGLARLVVQLRDQKRVRIRWYGTARDDTRPQVYGRSTDDRWAQGHDLEIVVEVPAQAAAEPSAGHTWAALALVADSAHVAPRRVGQEDVGPMLTVCAVPWRRRPRRARGSRSMAASMVTSTSASFGTGLSVASEPSRAIRKTPGVDCAARTNASTALSR